MTDTEIARRLRLGRREAFAVRDMLLALVREGELLTDARGRFGTAEQFGAKKGVFTGNERGFGFFAPDDGSGDLFIPRRATLGALHLDTVLAIPVAGKSDDEGEILAILSRGYREIVGTVSGDDTVLIICENSADAHAVCGKLENVLKM